MFSCVSHSLFAVCDPVGSMIFQLVLPVVHTCIYTIDVCVNDALVQCLQEPLPESLDIATEFDCSLHLALLDCVGGSEFNALITDARANQAVAAPQVTLSAT